MFKDAVRALDVGTLPQVGLVAFFVAFLLVLAYVAWLPKRDRTAYKHLPLDDALAGPSGDGHARPTTP